jgi:hypothetical protein
MSLYGRTDSNTNVTKARRGIAVTSQDKQVIFVDETEASLDENRQRGIHGPGWWSYYTFTDCEGNTRHKAEMLVSLADADTNAHETQADDTVAADKQYVILYEAGGNIGYYNSDPVLTALAVEIDPNAEIGNTGEVYFQWQKKASNGRWVNISDGGDYAIDTQYVDQPPTGNFPNGQEDFWSSTLTISDPGPSGDQTKYRVKLTSASGAPEVITEEYTLIYD